MTNSGGRWISGPYQNMGPGNYPAGVSMPPGNMSKNFPMMYNPGNMIGPQVRIKHVYSFSLTAVLVSAKNKITFYHYSNSAKVQ